MKTSMAHITMEAYEYVRQVDRAGKLAGSPADKTKSRHDPCYAMRLKKKELRRTYRHARLQSLRTGQWVPHRADSASDVSCVAAFSLWVSLWYSTCSLQWYVYGAAIPHGGEEQRCRAGCQDEPPPSLSHYNECPLQNNFFSSDWRHAVIQPRRAHLLHDLVTHIFRRSIQYGIVVMGVLDAFVYAHNHHRRMWITQRTLETLWKGEFDL